MFKRGFISPLVDDLPTLIFVTITLTVFFYIMSFCLEEYQKKVEMYNFNRYSIMLTNNLFSNGILSKSLLERKKQTINKFSEELGYHFDACLEKENCCEDIKSDKLIVSKYVVPWYKGNEIIPEVVKVCFW